MDIGNQDAGALSRHDPLDWGQATARVVIAFLLLVAVALAVGVSQRIWKPSAPVVTRPDNRCWSYQPDERGFARAINRSRVAMGLRKLSIDPELSKVARVHTARMVAIDAVHHQPEDTLRARVRNWLFLGENVGAGFSVETMHGNFLESPIHRRNILDPSFRHSGIGTMQARGRLWVTVLFEEVSDPYTTLAMPRC